MAIHLVIQLARFGDIIQTKRLIRSLQSGPDSEVHLAVDNSLKSLADLIYPEVVVHGLAAHGRDNPAQVLEENLPAFGTLRELDPDRVYNLNFSGLNMALAALFPEDRLRGYRVRAGQVMMDTWAALAFRWTRKRAESPINLVDFWAGLAREPVPPEQVNPEALAKGGGLGVVLAGRHARRTLPPEVLVPLVRALSARIDGPVYLLGGPGDKPLAQGFRKAADGKVLGRVQDKVGRTGWPELFELVGGLDAVMSPDTGTMHLAAHLGVPVQAFFLATAWGWETGPYGKGHRIWQSIADCSPCRESEPCPCGLRCLEPFKRVELLKSLATGKDVPELAPDLLALEPEFDALGQILTPRYGTDPYAEARRISRALLHEFRGLAPGENIVAAQLQAAADSLYLERDWMLDNDANAYLTLWS